jgi:two-component system alkaline phosphatase synthesis response regulator PhoP
LNRNKRILVVDDEQIICRAFEKELGEYGYQVDSANDGHMAYEMVKEQEYDLIFIDLILPGIDGIQLCRQIKAVQEKVKMIFMTGNVQTDPIFKEMEFVDAGGESYQLYKPFIDGELIEITRKVLGL